MCKVAGLLGLLGEEGAGMDYVQLAVPLGLIVWLAVWPLKGRARWAHAAAVLGVVALIGLVGQWGWPTAYAPYGLLALAVLAAAFGRRRVLGRGDRAGWLGGTLAAAVAMAAFGGVGLALEARLRPVQVVSLSLPVTGAVLVTEGGNHWAINAQMAVLDPDSPSLTSWRGAGLGVVLVAVDGWGRAKRAVMDVQAPCAGQVVLVTTDARLGQAVVLDCAGDWVVLGGMDGVSVAEGMQVVPGAAVGTAVALTLHAQTPGVAGHPFSGTPLAMVLDDRYAVRGMVLRGVAVP
jgi:hypothetical protein